MTRGGRIAGARVRSGEQRRRSIRVARMAIAGHVIAAEGGLEDRIADDPSPYARERALQAAVARAKLGEFVLGTGTPRRPTFGPQDPR